MKLMDIRPIRLTHQFEFIGDSTNEFYGRCVSFISSESREKRTPRLRHTHVYSLCFTPVDERNLSVGAISHEEKKTIILRYLNDSIPLYQIINSASVLWICPVCNLFSAWIQENAIFFSHHAMASVPFWCDRKWNYKIQNRTCRSKVFRTSYEDRLRWGKNLSSATKTKLYRTRLNKVSSIGNRVVFYSIEREILHNFRNEEEKYLGREREGVK